jgi:3-oxoacyl-[acyl-carrier protein] reductase
VGRAVSLSLAEQNAHVAIVYSRSRAETTAQEITQSGGRAICLQADIRDERSVRSMVQSVAEKFEGIDFLVNCAGITRQLPFDDLEAITDQIWDELIDTNLKGSFYCCRAATPFLNASQCGAIVNVGSIAGETGYGSSPPYAVSKAALHGLTRSLARALAPRIRVNCIAPGAVDTRWGEGHRDKMLALPGHLPLQRVSTPEDIASVVLALLQAKSMTGQIIRAENGQTL